MLMMPGTQTIPRLVIWYQNDGWCSLGPNSLPAGQADPAERLGFRCAMVSMLLIVLLSQLCFRSDTSVCSWSSGVCWLYFTNLRLVSYSHWLMHGHCLPAFWTRNPKILEPIMLLLISKAVRLVGPWIPGAWFMLARLTVLPVWSISIHQISFGRCADRLLRSRMLCTCHRLCKQFFWESAQPWPSPYVPGMLRLLFWWPSLGWPAWCVCAHHGPIHFCLPRADVAFLARTSRGRVNSCGLTGFCLGNEHSRLDLRASSLDNTYPWPLHKRVFFASGCYAIKCSGLATGLEQVRHKLPWDVGEHHVRLLANNARLSFHQWFMDDMEISGDWGPIWLRSWLALASWPGTGVCVCVIFLLRHAVRGGVPN